MMQGLSTQLNTLCDNQPFDTNWYVKNLKTGQAIDRAGDVVIPSASTRKIAILMAALKQINEGKLSLDDPFVLEAKYQNNNSGCFQYFKPGSTITFYDALVMMIIVSDNTCTGKIADIVGLDYVNELCQSIGMVGTTHREGLPRPEDLPLDHPVEVTNATTANDVGLLCELIVNGMTDEQAAAKLGCSTELCQLAIQIMSWQKNTHKLPAQMPNEAWIAHKTGTGTRNANDAGIVFKGDEPQYVITVYTDGVPRGQRDGANGQTAAAHHIATLCRAAWDGIVA